MRILDLDQLLSSCPRTVLRAEADDALTASEWYESQRPDVKELVRRFPPGTRIEYTDCIMYVIAYRDPELLLVSPIDPRTDIDTARSWLYEVPADSLADAI